MSDTDNQEDLSVEDILSSIKNILVDEEGEPKPSDKQEEDVLNLDTSMIVTKKEPQSIENILDSITEPVTATSEETKKQETSSLADSIDIEKTIDIADQIDLKDVPALDSFVEQTSSALSGSSAVKEETIDASANIINNFAKVFAEKQHALQTTPQGANIASEVSSGIEKLGISNMVEETLVSQIKQNINAHFEQIASKIIAEQTQQWLNANLAAIVEKTVAKEIERVIAKVGS